MLSNRGCAIVLLILCVLFALAQPLRGAFPALQGIVGAPVVLLGPGWAVLRFFTPGLRPFEAVVALALSLAVWTLMALLLLAAHLWQPLVAADLVLVAVAVVAVLVVVPRTAGRPA
jgi:hypothetical protein